MCSSCPEVTDAHAVGSRVEWFPLVYITLFFEWPWSLLDEFPVWPFFDANVLGEAEHKIMPFIWAPRSIFERMLPLVYLQLEFLIFLHKPGCVRYYFWDLVLFVLEFFTHTTNIPGTCLLIADSQFASRLYNCVPRRTWNTWHSFVNNILSPSKKTCLNLVPQMDVSSTNLMLDTSIWGTSFFGWRE